MIHSTKIYYLQDPECWNYEEMATNIYPRGVCRTLPNIYDGVYLQK